MQPPFLQLNRLRQALSEMHAHRAAFSEDTFNTIVMLLLNELRTAQTLTNIEDTASDEIRLVTVMFADIKDSTELVHQLEAGDWKSLIAETHELIASVVAVWEGQVGQYLGDGVLCFFGAQRSRGDDAPHAVSCALEIQQVMGIYSESIKDRYGIDFGVRISISTGRVVVGMIGSQTTKQELLALGAATNLAARLQALAPVGDVLVDATTHQRIRREFVTQAQAPVRLKGFDELIRSYLVLERRTQPATQFTEHQIVGLDLPLVGRDDELALINRCAEQARQQHKCEVITLTGDVGIGKSRLLQETVQLMDAHFTQIVMSGHYDKQGHNQALLRDLLVVHCHINDDTPLDIVQQQVESYVMELWDHPDASQAAAAIAYLAGFSVTAPPGNLVEWVLRWFAGAASTNPLMIAIDNLHWVDEQSVALLEQLVLYLADYPCVLIGAGQREFQTLHPAYMSQYQRHTTVALDMLTSVETRDLIDRVLHHVDRVPESLIETINQRSEGNPLFVYEYLSMLFDNDTFQPTENQGWRFNILMMDTALQTIPNRLLSILQARVDSLHAQARQVIQAAAVIGQVFWQEAIEVILSRNDVQSALDHLLMRGVIVEDEQSDLANQRQFHFGLSLYRTVAYEMIPRAKRETLHRETAIWLLGKISGQAHLYALLAQQFERSRQYMAALYAYVETIEVKLMHNEVNDALDLIDVSLSLVNHLDREEALTIATRLWAYRSQTLAALGRYDESSAAGRSALMLLDELSPSQLPSVRFQAERILGAANIALGRFNEAYDALTRAHTMLPYNASGDISNLLQSFAMLTFYQGRLQDSEAYGRRAYEHALTAGSDVLKAKAATAIAIVQIERGKIFEALTLLESAQEIYETKGMDYYARESLLQIGIVHLLLLQFEQANTYFSATLDTNTNHMNPIAQAYQAYTLLMLDRKAQAQSLLTEAISQRPRDVFIQVRLRVIQLAALYLQGEYVQVREQAMALLQESDINPVYRARTMLWLGIASHLLRANNAQVLLQEALALESAYGGRDLWLCHLMLARCQGDVDVAKSHYQEAAKLLKERADQLKSRPDLYDGLLQATLTQSTFEHAAFDMPLSGD